MALKEIVFVVAILILIAATTGFVMREPGCRIEHPTKVYDFPADMPAKEIWAKMNPEMQEYHSGTHDLNPTRNPELKKFLDGLKGAK